MTRFRSSALLCVLSLAAGACSRDATFTEPVPPLAAIHFVNAVPDTNQMAFRIVDIVSNAGLYGATFRSNNMFPMGIEAGTRHIRVFFDTSDVVLAKKVWLDTTYTFTAGEHYTFMLTGFSRAGETPVLGGLITVDGVPPTLAPGKFAIRVLNAAPSFAGAVPALADTTVHPDAFVRPVKAAPGGTPEGVDLAYLATSQYAVLDTGLYSVALTATGTVGPTIVQSSVPAGVLGTSTANPIAGSSVAGSVLTAVIVSRSVLASKAPQGGTPAAKTAVELVTRSNDTVTVQTGSITVLVNRSPTKPDSTLSKTNGGATTGVATGDVVLVSGATEPEYNGWQAVTLADSLSCNPVDPADTPTKCAAPNDSATTRFRFRYRITGAPTSPATGTPVYRIYPPSPPATTADYTIPYIIYLVDKRPPDTY